MLLVELTCERRGTTLPLLRAKLLFVPKHFLVRNLLRSVTLPINVRLRKRLFKNNISSTQMRTAKAGFSLEWVSAITNWTNFGIAGVLLW